MIILMSFMAGCSGCMIFMSVDAEHLTLQLVESSDGRFFVRFS